MAITTFAELQTAVAKWLNRDDLTATIPDFITLNEKVMQRTLKTMEMEVTGTLATVANSPLVALPTGFMGLRRLRILIDSSWRDVQIVSLEPSLDDGVNPSRPIVASIVGSNIYFKPIPDGVYPLSIDYWAKFTPLSDSAPSNWILADNPDAYLYGTLLQSAPYLGTDKRLPLWENGFQLVMDQINSENIATQFSNMKLRCDPALTMRPRANLFTGRGIY